MNPITVAAASQALQQAELANELRIRRDERERCARAAWELAQEYAAEAKELRANITLDASVASETDHNAFGALMACHRIRALPDKDKPNG